MSLTFDQHQHNRRRPLTQHQQPASQPGIGPWSLTSARVAFVGSQESLRYEAALTHNGHPFATVTNDGQGGCDLRRPLTPADRPTLAEFGQYAVEWGLSQPEPVWLEPADALTTELLAAALGEDA